MLAMFVFLLLGLWLVSVLAAYWFGWYWRGRFEKRQWAANAERRRREREWTRRLELQELRNRGPQLKRVK